MTQLWIPRVTRLPANKAGVPFTTTTRRAVWHTTESHPGSLLGVVAWFRTSGSWPHITWDPATGELAQHLPANVGSRALRNLAGGAETNSFGALQIEVIGRAAQPFTDRPMIGVERILRWLRANGVPDDWPAGQPLAYGRDLRRPGVIPAAYGLGNGTRKLSVWAQPGHFGHSQVPENDHGDPGRVDITFTQAAPEREWDEMATEAQIRKVVAEELEKALTKERGKYITGSPVSIAGKGAARYAHWTLKLLQKIHPAEAAELDQEYGIPQTKEPTP